MKTPLLAFLFLVLGSIFYSDSGFSQTTCVDLGYGGYTAEGCEDKTAGGGGDDAPCA